MKQARQKRWLKKLSKHFNYKAMLEGYTEGPSELQANYQEMQNFGRAVDSVDKLLVIEEDKLRFLKNIVRQQVEKNEFGESALSEAAEHILSIEQKIKILSEKKTLLEIVLRQFKEDFLHHVDVTQIDAPGSKDADYKIVKQDRNAAENLLDECIKAISSIDGTLAKVKQELVSSKHTGEQLRLESELGRLEEERKKFYADLEMYWDSRQNMKQAHQTIIENFRGQAEASKN